MNMADLAKIVEELSALTVLEASDLSQLLEEKCGVSAAAAVAAAPAAAAAGPAAAEQTAFDVLLPGDGGQKINVINEVRSITDRTRVVPGNKVLGRVHLGGSRPLNTTT